MHPPYTPATDLSDQAAPLSESFEVPLLGVPVAYSSNSAAVIELAARALARWGDLPRTLVEVGPPARVAIVVHPPSPGEPALPQDEPFVCRAYGDTFLAAGGGNLLCAHLAAGSATAFVTPALIADEPALRQSVIERLGLLLVSQRDRTPIPAAGVVRNGRALLLVGPSAVDLSTLSYACVWAGFGLMAAETTWVSLGRGQRLWGHASPIRMPVDAVRFFPDLAGVAPGMGANGEPTLAIDIEARWPERLATHAERAVVCLIERAAGQASRLEPVPAAAAAAIMGDLRAPGHSRLSEQAPAVVQALTARGAHRLSLGADPASAAALLAHLAEAGQW